MTTKISALPANQQIAWVAGAAVTVSTPLLNLTQTWNAVGTTFTAGLINITDTASASGSLLLDLQVGGASKLTLTKAGQLTIASNLFLPSSGLLAFGTTVLQADAANTLALRNGVSANGLKVANTFTDLSNNEYGVFSWLTNANRLTIGSQHIGTGSARPVDLVGNDIQIKSNDGALTWDFATAGTLIAGLVAGTLVLKQGANGCCGTFVANGASAVTVSNTNVAVTDTISISLNTVGGTVGAHPVVKTITAATGFTVTATAADTSTYNYVIIKNAA